MDNNQRPLYRDVFENHFVEPTSQQQGMFPDLEAPVKPQINIMDLIARKEAQRYTSSGSAYSDRGYGEEEESSISMSGFLGNHSVRFDLEPRGYLYDIRCFEGARELVKYQIGVNKCIVCLSETEIYEVTLFPARESFVAQPLQYEEVLARLEI